MPKPTSSIQVSSFPAKVCRWLLLAVAFAALQGCASLIVDPLVAPFEQSLEQQTNLDLLHDGTPSLLLIIDGLLANAPNDQKMLISGTKAYSSYAVLLTQFQEHKLARSYAEHGRELAHRLLATIPSMAKFPQTSPSELTDELAKVRPRETAALFWGGYGCAIWARLQDGSPAGLATLTKIERLMQRVNELDESFYHGGAHIFLGSLNGAKPPMLGGKPEVSLAHFEKALMLNQRQFLPTQVAMAETYARQVFDRDLFKALLEEVLAAPLEADPKLKASNSLAKMKAKQLLARIDDFF